MKKIYAVVLVLISVILFTACGGDKWQESYDLGMRYLSEGNYAEAIIAFDKAIEIDPKQPLAYVGRADTYIASGETESNLAVAFDDYTAAIKLDATNAYAWLGLADVYIRQGEYDKAEETLQKALEKTNRADIIADKIAEIEERASSNNDNSQKNISYFENENSDSFTVVNVVGKTENEAIQILGENGFDGIGTNIEYSDIVPKGVVIRQSPEAGSRKQRGGRAIIYVSNGIRANPVKKIELAPAQVTLKVGESVQLLATIEPADANEQQIFWSSSNPSVASIGYSGDGKVYAKEAGRATIIGQTQNGIKSECEVIVTSREETVIKEGSGVITSVDVYTNTIDIEEDSGIENYKMSKDIKVTVTGMLSATTSSLAVGDKVTYSVLDGVVTNISVY